MAPLGLTTMPSLPLLGTPTTSFTTFVLTLEAVAARHGFCLNTKKGKTECVITFAGKGIMAAKRALDWQEDHAQLRYGDEGILRLVDSYKHLGTLHDQYLCRTPELFRRAKTARTAVGAISRRILRNTKLPISVRRQASLACIDGALFSAAGWWSPPTQRELRILNAPRSLMLRALANVKPGPGGPTDAELRKQLKVPPLRLSCRQLDCDIYHACFALLRPLCVPFSDSPVRVNGDRPWQRISLTCRGFCQASLSSFQTLF